MRRPIPTVYRGQMVRSLNEARWLGFFDEIGWAWTYESIEAIACVPDVMIEGAPMALSLNGRMPNLSELEGAATHLADAMPGWAHPVVAVGPSPFAVADVYVYPDRIMPEGYVPAGILTPGPILDFREWCIAYWARCDTCGTLGLGAVGAVHPPMFVGPCTSMLRQRRPGCGFYWRAVARPDVEAPWKAAGNKTRYRKEACR